MKIGIIGIGMLGEAVALNLLNSGYHVAVYNRTKEKTIEVEKKGARVMDSPKVVAENVELIIIIVKDAIAVREVAFGENGIIEIWHTKFINTGWIFYDTVEVSRMIILFYLIWI